MFDLMKNRKKTTQSKQEEYTFSFSYNFFFLDNLDAIKPYNAKIINLGKVTKFVGNNTYGIKNKFIEYSQIIALN